MTRRFALRKGPRPPLGVTSSSTTRHRPPGYSSTSPTATSGTGIPYPTPRHWPYWVPEGAGPVAPSHFLLALYQLPTRPGAWLLYQDPAFLQPLGSSWKVHENHSRSAPVYLAARVATQGPRGACVGHGRRVTAPAEFARVLLAGQRQQQPAIRVADLIGSGLPAALLSQGRVDFVLRLQGVR